MKLLYNILIILGVCSIIVYLFISNQNLKNSIIQYDNNVKALSFERDSLSNSLIAYKLSVEELEMLNDSIIEDLNNTRKELKIKDKQILQMQSIKTEVNTKDSIFVKDTIFKNTFVKLDTSITNKWYDITLKLEYPSTIEIETLYRSDLSVFAYSNREILGTPKKCFIGRLFQKKYDVIRVEVHDNNPHSIIKENKFVIIE